HKLTEFEVRLALAGLGSNRTLAGNQAQFFDSYVNNFLVLCSISQTLVDYNLVQAWYLHDAGVLQLSHQFSYNFFFVVLFQSGCVLAHLITSPDFLAILVIFPFSTLRPTRVAVPDFGSTSATLLT